MLKNNSHYVISMSITYVGFIRDIIYVRNCWSIIAAKKKIHLVKDLHREILVNKWQTREKSDSLFQVFQSLSQVKENQPCKYVQSYTGNINIVWQEIKTNQLKPEQQKQTLEPCRVSEWPEAYLQHSISPSVSVHLKKQCVAVLVHS